MTAVEHAQQVRIAGSDVGDQARQFLVGEIPLAVVAAVVANQGFVEMVRLDVPELGRCALLRAMTAVIEKRDVVGARFGKMVPETCNNIATGGPIVFPLLQLDNKIARFTELLRKRCNRFNVVHASVQGRNGSLIGIDAHQGGVKRSYHGSCSRGRSRLKMKQLSLQINNS